MRRLLAFALSLSLAASTLAPTAAAAPPALPDFEALLAKGELADAQRKLEAHLAANPQDDNARLALGVVQTLRGVERAMQSLYRYGLDPKWQSALPLLRLPVPKNPHPEPLTNEAFRQIVADFVIDLAKAEATLAQIKSADVKLPLAVGMYRLDFDGDGQATEQETLWKVLARIATDQRITSKTAKAFVIVADKGDVHWLCGYCHLLQAVCETHLAYDTQNMHDHCASLFFPTAKMRYAFPHDADPQTWEWILDGIAFIHLFHFDVKEPERLQAAHAHFLAVIAQSRESWTAIEAETDDDREWIPNPKQKNAAIPGAAVTGEMMTGWRSFLDEAEQILNGQKLVPFWRGNDPRGVNLKKVFYEPQTFDLVLWVQGSAALPYLEAGEVTKPERWQDIQRIFRGQLFWFAFWVN